MADLLVAKGYAKAGYTHLNLDGALPPSMNMLRVSQSHIMKRGHYRSGLWILTVRFCKHEPAAFVADEMYSTWRFEVITDGDFRI